jgi:hypothetical protein
MEIVDLRTCHETRSKFKVWACNEIKMNLDECFRQEKEKVLKELNKDLDERRREDEAQAAISTGKNVTFHQYLATDTTYQKELEDLQKNKGKSWFGF